MAKKSKGFGQLLKQQKRSQKIEGAFSKLEKDMKDSPVGQHINTVLHNPEGKAKMSDVLEAFVEPYEDEDMTLTERRNMYGMAVIAWNLAIAPPEKRKAMKADFIKEGLQNSTADIQREVIDLLDAMIVRKEKLFASNTRYIISYQLEDLGDEFHLSVGSTVTS